MLHRSLLLLVGLFFCMGFNAHAKDTAPAFFPKKLPIECRDRETYDLSDCDSTMRLEFKKEEQDKLPDNQRINFTQLGDNLLLEKATGLRAGLYKIQITADKNPSTGFIIGTQKSALTYGIGSFEGCNRGSAIKILKNAPEFTFFYWQCDDLRPNRRETQYFNYYIFDKRYNRLDSILSSSHQEKLPTLTLSKGLYKFNWLDYRQSDGSSNPIFYNFKITGNRPVDLKCGRTWNDECDITMIAPLTSGQYKVLDE